MGNGIPYFRKEVAEELYRSVPEHLSLYRKGSFDEVVTEEQWILAGNFRLSEISALVGNSPIDDAKDAEIIYGGLRFSPAVACDERLWSHLCHFLCLDYVRRRWPIPSEDEKAVSHVRRHFFVQNRGRGLERDNALSRLWWMAHLASKADNLELSNSLEYLMWTTDARAQVVERPSTSQSTAIYRAVINTLKKFAEEEPDKPYGQSNLPKPYLRHINREFFRRLNLLGGGRILDAVPESTLQELVDQCMADSIVAKMSSNE